MSSNQYGLDNDYFERKIAILHRDGLRNWRPDELARELARMSRTADKSVMYEPEFAAPVVERQDGSALMKIAADLANRHPLRQLYLVCDRQGRINTDSLHEHLDKCGDLLAGIALDIRRAITAPPELAELPPLMVTLADHKAGKAAYLEHIKELQATIARLTADLKIRDRELEIAAEYHSDLQVENERLKAGQGEAE